MPERDSAAMRYITALWSFPIRPAFLECLFEPLQRCIEGRKERRQDRQRCSYLAHNHLIRFATLAFGRVNRPSGWEPRRRPRGRSQDRTAPRPRTPLTGGRSAPVGRAEQRAIVTPEHEQYGLAVQPVRRWLMGGAGGDGPVEKPDLLQRPDCAPDARFGEAEGGVSRQLAPVDRERG